MIYAFLLLVISFNEPTVLSNESNKHSVNSAIQMYSEMDNESLSYEAFEMAYKGWVKLKDSISFEKNLISLVDFSQPSTQKRFYLIDMDSHCIVYQNYVAHGKNSGMLNASKFSNIVHSNQSSLGFYKTGETYYGKHGLSLKLDGLEKGINDKARKRHIVIHQAAYAEEAFIKKYGRLGRSFGCPALPAADYNLVIDQIKNGTMLFIYHPLKAYQENSTVLN